MRIILAAAAATIFATAAFAADPVAPPAPVTKPVITMPASAAPPDTCAQMIVKARAMTLPSDATKAKSVRDELAAADAANNDTTCKAHANNALNLLSGM
ncbi:MAG TPA: hypothetical protein VJ476_14645 [Rhizomicrobium sp.]|nr:hypothetical protein [Rhizomicrobium sp.]